MMVPLVAEFFGKGVEATTEACLTDVTGTLRFGF